MIDILYYFLYYFIIILGIILFIIILINNKKYRKINDFKVTFNNKNILNNFGSLIYIVKPNLFTTLVFGSYLELIIFFNIYKDIKYFSKNYSLSGLTSSIIEIIIIVVILFISIWYSYNKIFIYENAIVIKRLFLNKTFYYDKIDYIQSFKGSIINTNKVYGYKIICKGELKYRLHIWRFKDLDKIETIFNLNNKNIQTISCV